ncbi:hypothetical protein [Allorhizocola rhizosphaerae]|uniref:hypothetical protein n=1 Tax=Allorhizocola rhizosphaerae TaxID=1872709 RepID=UPI001B8B63E4|nr:hypothetical protein [Allorhizocola rhizosphaerae]
MHLLADSFVIDDAGYFIDDAWSSARSPFSIYETYWQIRWRGGRLPEGMDPARLAPWVAVGSVGALDSSPLQHIGQIALAAGIAREIGLNLDSSRTAAKLETLRSGYLYSPDPQVEGTWGSTAAAVRAMRDLSIPVPEEVVHQAKLELKKLPDVLTPGVAVGTALPLLEVVVMTHKQADSLQPVLRRVLDAALESLDRIPNTAMDASTLGAQFQLEGVRRALGLAPQVLAAGSCASLLRGRGFVSLPGSDASDIQASFYARELGCKVVDDLKSPYTRAGWLLRSAVDPYKTLAATAAAIRLASLVGRENDLAQKVMQSIAKFWLPLMGDGSLSLQARAVASARLSNLIRITKVDVSAMHPAGVNAAPTGPATAMIDLAAVWSADQKTRSRVAIANFTNTERHNLGGRVSIEMAAEISLASIYVGDESMLSKAKAILDRLRISDGVYAAVECDVGKRNCSSFQPSIAASALGSWISKSIEKPHRSWLALGICRGYICADKTNDGTTLRQLYISFVCGQPACGIDLPFII